MMDCCFERCWVLYREMHPGGKLGLRYTGRWMVLHWLPRSAAPLGNKLAKPGEASGVVD
jgi:hypothetical protein